MGYFKRPTDPEGISKLRDLLGGLTYDRAVRVDDTETGCVYYQNKPGEKPSATGFSGKRTSPDFNYSFRTEQRRDEYIAGWLNGIKESAAFKATQARTRKEFVTTLVTGDVLHGSYGYDQTNAVFMQITSVSGNRVTVRPIAHRSAPGSSSMVVACPNEFTGPDEKKVVQFGNHVSYQCYNLYKWDGLPCYETDAYSGH